MKTVFGTLSIISVLAATTMSARADDTARVAELSQLYNAAQDVCVGISDELQHLKNVTTGNAVVSGVGTAAAGGALYAGLTKAQVDRRIEELQKKICDAGGCDEKTVEQMSDEDFFSNVIIPMSEIVELMRSELQDADKKSKRLGNWRTGLMAGATATSITSAILAGVSKDQSDLIQQITACNNAIDMIAHADMSGLNPFDNQVVMKLGNIKTWCKSISPDDIERIAHQQRVIMGTSIAGAATGTAGTVTSAVANSKSVRNDNTDAGRKKEKNLNTTANVMAGATTVLGGVSTGVSISAVSRINKIIKQASLCEEVF